MTSRTPLSHQPRRVAARGSRASSSISASTSAAGRRQLVAGEGEEGQRGDAEVRRGLDGAAHAPRRRRGGRRRGSGRWRDAPAAVAVHDDRHVERRSGRRGGRLCIAKYPSKKGGQAGARPGRGSVAGFALSGRRRRLRAPPGRARRGSRGSAARPSGGDPAQRLRPVARRSSWSPPPGRPPAAPAGGG